MGLAVDTSYVWMVYEFQQKEQAIKSQSTSEAKDVLERAEQFKEKYLQRLEILKRNPW